MNIDSYKILISNLPVRQQCFTTKRKTWKNAETELMWLKDLNDKLFGEIEILIISRQDIFETTELREIIVKTIYWGYTGGMRNNYHLDVFRNIQAIEDDLIKLKNNSIRTNAQYEDFRKSMEKIRGIKLSTYSKLLYFLQLTFNDNPCLILDQRLIDVFASKTYSEFNLLYRINYDNAEKRYLEFLRLANQVAKDLETDGENIEQFLFTFGNNLKNNKIEKPSR